VSIVAGTIESTSLCLDFSKSMSAEDEDSFAP